MTDEQRRIREDINYAVWQFLGRCEQAQNDIADLSDLIPYNTDDELLLDDVHMKINEAMDLVRQRFLPKRTL